MKTKNSKKNKRQSFALKKQKICNNCGQLTTHGHFAPPSLGEKGFFICGAKFKNMKIEIGKRYRIKYIDALHPQNNYEGVGVVQKINPEGYGYEKNAYKVFLEDIADHGYFYAEDFVEELPSVLSEEDNLKSWLKYILEAPGRELWMDSRDDAADDLVWAAEQALSGRSFEEYTKEHDE